MKMKLTIIVIAAALACALAQEKPADAPKIVIPPAALSSLISLKAQAQGAAAAAAAADHVATEAQQKFTAALEPWCMMQKIELAQCAVDPGGAVHSTPAVKPLNAKQ